MEDYFDPKHPGSFGGVDKFYKQSSKDFKKRELVDFLASKDTYTLHRPTRKRFARRRIFTTGINDLWQADLCDMTSLARYNDGNKFLLTCIDVFSKVAWAIPLKNKSASVVAAGFEKILQSGQPNYLQTDKGKEFLNATFQRLLKDRRILFYTTQNEDIKAACAERFNRTLKAKMWRYFTYKATLRYIDVLDDLLFSYNNTIHRTIKTTPASVDSSNEREILTRCYRPKKTLKWKLRLNDKVRISQGRREFKKAHLSDWTEEIFTIIVRHPTDPVTYEVCDYNDDKINGKFYEHELQKIKKDDDIYRVEKILKTRKVKGEKQYYVKWKGYPKSFNSWTTDLRRI